MVKLTSGDEYFRMESKAECVPKFFILIKQYIELRQQSSQKIHAPIPCAPDVPRTARVRRQVFPVHLPDQ